MSLVGLGVFWGILFLVTVMAWSRVWINRRLCKNNPSTKKAEHDSGPASKNLSASDPDRDAFQTKIDTAFDRMGLKDKELRAAAEDITECPSIPMQLFWGVLALAITVVCVGLAWWAWKRYTFVPELKDVCSINILECDDIEAFCYNPVSDSDVRQCTSYCANTTPLYTADCIVQHCDSQISKAIQAEETLSENKQIVDHCLDHCFERDEEGIASFECKALMCSMPVDEDEDVYAGTCETFCSHPNLRYGPLCVDRVCADTLAGACACVKYLDTGDGSAECLTYCAENTGDPLCREYFCEVDNIVGCHQTCQPGIPYCAPDDVTGDPPVHLYSPQLHRYIGLHLTLVTTSTAQFTITNRDNTKNLYAITQNSHWLGMDGSRRGVYYDDSERAALFQIIPTRQPHIYYFMTLPVEISPGYYTPLFLSYNHTTCIGDEYVFFATRPVNAQLPDIEWWVGSGNPIESF